MYDKIKEFYEENINVFNTLLEIADLIEPDERLYPMAMFDEIFQNETPLEIAYLLHNSSFDPFDEYFSYGVYLESYDAVDYSDLIDSYHIEALADTVEAQYYKNCPEDIEELYDLYVEEGLIDGIDIDDEEVELGSITEELLTNELSALDGIASDFDEE